jgi:hypothetical protein
MDLILYFLQSHRPVVVVEHHLGVQVLLAAMGALVVVGQEMEHRAALVVLEIRHLLHQAKEIMEGVVSLLLRPLALTLVVAAVVVRLP